MSKSTSEFKKDLVRVYLKHGFGENCLHSLTLHGILSDMDPSKTIKEIASEMGITETPTCKLELMEE